jgi:uncharacterized protein YlxW (UPF0749 family)
MITARRDPATLAAPMFLNVTTLSVDPAYVEAAARRAAGDRPRTHAATAALMIALTLIALLLTVAAQQTRRRAPEAARVREGLAQEARERTAATDELRARRESLLSLTGTARDARLRATQTGRGLADRLSVLEQAVGSVAVTGPGVRVRLDDSPDAGGPDDPNGDGRVRDRDLQEVVNALWAAGAEAVAVNGQRVSALTAIREAGQAILVDYRPISAPYVVEAIGEAGELESDFVSSDTAARFRTFTDFYGLAFSVRQAERLELPAAETVRLRYAEVDAT